MLSVKETIFASVEYNQLKKMQIPEATDVAGITLNRRTKEANKGIDLWLAFQKLWKSFDSLCFERYRLNSSFKDSSFDVCISFGECSDAVDRWLHEILNFWIVDRRLLFVVRIEIEDVDECCFCGGGGSGASTEWPTIFNSSIINNSACCKFFNR